MLKEENENNFEWKNKNRSVERKKQYESDKNKEETRKNPVSQAFKLRNLDRDQQIDDFRNISQIEELKKEVPNGKDKEIVFYIKNF